MTQQRKFLLVGVIFWLVGALAGCTASAVQVPQRTITTSVNDAIAAQQAGMAVLTSGKVEWTESQLSSLLTEGLKQNTGKNMPIDAINVWFEPNNEIYLRVALKEGVLKQGNTLDLKGSVAIQDHHVVVNFQGAGVGSMSVNEPILTMINGQIDKALGGANLGIAATVKTDTGKLTLQIGG